MDKNVTDVIEKYKKRADHGFKKYGVTTERTDIDLQGWLVHLQEELMNATIYIQRTIAELVTVYVVWRADDEMTHIFSTQEKAQAYADSLGCSCALSTYLVDDPEHMYARSQ